VKSPEAYLPASRKTWSKTLWMPDGRKDFWINLPIAKGAVNDLIDCDE
jgi:hypothetical protein